MIDIKKHIINQHQPLSSALIMLDELGEDLTLFVVDNDGQKKKLKRGKRK